ncbi:uncharacterized protein EHS24_008390 [Apiotrichum porosum]|uniref:Methyltransferase domain-containing protein n=1 Tax=Apiotrichum porosum TaxID=105984 RepID=A0A427XQ34_9TREE|nr:uncharacterized protein EHS24_008390 [Apiotrichum porosum]RSH80959.1 hypothetical protein EHS24_008390 [Apiotrichum porosum]
MGVRAHSSRDTAPYGVDEYYRKVAATYRNPFFAGIKKVVWTLMARWWDEEGGVWGPGGSRVGDTLRVLDMAAGSGEATLCLLEWEAAGKRASLSSTPSSPTKSPPRLPLSVQSTLPVRPAFTGTSTRRRPASGADNAAMPSFPRAAPPPHSGTAGSARTATPRPRVFSAGTPPPLPRALVMDIIATDPYTSPAYFARTSRVCHPLSFADLAAGRLPPSRARDAMEVDDSGPEWDMIVCSFALHLLTEASELAALLDELSRRATWLVVVAPHREPEPRLSPRTAARREREREPDRDRDEDDETELEIVRDK